MKCLPVTSQIAGGVEESLISDDSIYAWSLFTPSWHQLFQTELGGGA
jgi:hypothetical protein